MKTQDVVRNIRSVDVISYRSTTTFNSRDTAKSLNKHLANEFIGLMLNIGASFQYKRNGFDPIGFAPKQFDFLYLPKGHYAKVIDPGLHHTISICIERKEVIRWSKDIPDLKFFLLEMDQGRPASWQDAHFTMNTAIESELRFIEQAKLKNDALSNLLIASRLQYILFAALQINSGFLRPQAKQELKVDVGQRHQIAGYIDSKKSEQITIQEIEDFFSINRKKLQKGFSAVFGLTVHKYIQEHRMKNAKELLKNPTNSVKRIAQEIGYRYPENFITAYKKYFKQSPRSKGDE